MSRFSSLCLFYPGPPPPVTVGALRGFAEELRARVGIDPTPRREYSVKFGDRIDRDKQSVLDTGVDDTGLWPVPAPYPWDVEIAEAICRIPEEIPWPESIDNNWNIYRAWFHLGRLTREAAREIWPCAEEPLADIYDWMSVGAIINPFSVPESDRGACRCIGFLSVVFDCGGYVNEDEPGVPSAPNHDSPRVLAARTLCREHFPVVRGPAFEEVAGQLGALFLNRADYRDGDWIMTHNS